MTNLNKTLLKITSISSAKLSLRRYLIIIAIVISVFGLIMILTFLFFYWGKIGPPIMSFIRMLGEAKTKMYAQSTSQQTTAQAAQ
jgi:hypothetical protein